jgi:hypothetical protein
LERDHTIMILRRSPDHEYSADVAAERDAWNALALAQRRVDWSGEKAAVAALRSLGIDPDA